MAQHWWMQSVGSLDRRDMQQIVGLEDSGLSVWAGVFQEEGSVDPSNDLQDVSFDQKLSGMQTGIEWKGDVGGGSFSVGPMYSYGSASANQNANLADARGDASAFGLNAGYRFGNGLYLNATWQQMAMEIDFRTPGTLSHAIGTTDAEGDGFNVELGYAHKLNSGLTLAPQLQYASVTVDLDDFTSSDGVYALSGLGWQALAAARRTVGLQDLRNQERLHHAAGGRELSGRAGWRQHAVVERHCVQQRHLGIGLPCRVRRCRPLQGLGHHRASGIGGVPRRSSRRSLRICRSGTAGRAGGRSCSAGALRCSGAAAIRHPQRARSSEPT